MQAARFGVFEVDVTAHELRKCGTRVHMQEQPFQLLAFLLRRAGDVVTRAELHNALWPADTYVDFDKSLNTAVKKVRMALNDPAASPRFIETLPKIGYRFVAPLQLRENGIWRSIPPAPDRRSEALPERRRDRRRMSWRLAVGLLSIAGVVWLAVGAVVERTTGPALHPVPLTSYPGVEIHPAFAPDGKRIAFAWSGEKNDNYDIYVKDIDSGRLQRLTSDPAEDSSPAWSPDGRWIAFARRSLQQADVYVVPAHGGPANKVAAFRPAGPRILGVHDVLSADSGPYLCWSANGKSLVLPASKGDTGGTGLLVVSLATGERRPLTQSSTADSQPALSPDGRTLAFIRAEGLGLSDIYVLAVSPTMESVSEPRRLTFGHASVQGPAWSQDGSELFFTSGEMVGSRRLLRVAVRGSARPKSVWIPSENVSSPTVGRGAASLVYSEERADRNIWHVKLMGTSPKAGRPEIVMASTYLEKQPRLSPDGKHMVFVSSRSGVEEIWLSDADGSDAQQLTHFGGMAVGSPHWSPDGTQIVFDGFPHGSGEIYVIPAKPGSTPVQLTKNADQDVFPAWSGDGRSIYFASWRGGDHQIWKMQVNVPAPEHETQVTRRGASFGPDASPDGKFVYYMKGGEVWRVPCEGGKEEPVITSLPAISGYALDRDGIYVLRRGASQHSTVEFVSLVSGRIMMVLSVQKPISHLSVSNAGDWLLYTQVDQEAADLMWVPRVR